ncbi:MAG: zinc ribbon domain-containing protein [Nitrospirae bacterium]|nr:zinc ribbon domain-containing protein [Nitrospirota bacterium]
MPIYEYRCTNCDEEFEVMQKINDAPLTECKECGGELKKLITNTSFVLKGSGWYVTDYPSADREKAAKKKKSASAEKDTKSGQKIDSGKEAVKA